MPNKYIKTLRESLFTQLNFDYWRVITITIPMIGGQDGIIFHDQVYLWKNHTCLFCEKFSFDRI